MSSGPMHTDDSLYRITDQHVFELEMVHIEPVNPQHATQCGKCGSSQRTHSKKIEYGRVTIGLVSLCCYALFRGFVATALNAETVGVGAV